MAAVGREQQGLRGFVVLGLRKEIHRQPVGRRAAVGNHQDLRRSGDHVDADLPEHLALRLGDVDIARPDDLVDARHGRGAIGERGDRLRAADADDALDARQRRRSEHQRIRIRAHHDELADAGNLRRHRVHQHRGGIGRLAAGDVEADALERAQALAEARTVGLQIIPR